eukprot:5405608-Pyramimonas_sp.AAC.1
MPSGARRRRLSLGGFMRKRVRRRLSTPSHSTFQYTNTYAPLAARVVITPTASHPASSGQEETTQPPYEKRPRLADTSSGKKTRVLYDVSYDCITYYYYTTCYTERIILRIRIGQPRKRQNILRIRNIRI